MWAFCEIAKLEGLNPIGAQVSQFFLQPNFTTLVRRDAGADGEIYRGLLTMGDNIWLRRGLCAPAFGGWTQRCG